MELDQNQPIYNGNNQKICGYPTLQGPCKNTRYCRFHSKIRPKTFSHYNKGAWHPQEHKIFIEGIKKFGIGHWVEISNELTTRNPSQCQVHFYKLQQRLGITAEDFIDYIDTQMVCTIKNHSLHENKLAKQNKLIFEAERNKVPTPFLNTINTQFQQQDKSVSPYPFIIDSNSFSDFYNYLD
ncbi:Myb-like DNA-binding domain-containing protein [Spironucleus salmonicida]|uniref:Myb-like DNA-binding domain-containing protein n=1 Tax=Spironucleus salmonicida TaxID=348837 RepID=V6LX70_9EUKA|nr:Myb-like DNA-binding domain-containing protein [Spironucleus salmonicida]|eukprot:EST45419.1 Myb-like DNA-binding domain-containing protein [Spironucleus salmonicida]